CRLQQRCIRLRRPQSDGDLVERDPGSSGVLNPSRNFDTLTTLPRGGEELDAVIFRVGGIRCVSKNVVLQAIERCSSFRYPVLGLLCDLLKRVTRAHISVWHGCENGG